MTPLATVALAVAVPWLWVGLVKSVARHWALAWLFVRPSWAKSSWRPPLLAALPGQGWRLEAQGHRHDQAVAPQLAGRVAARPVRRDRRPAHAGIAAVHHQRDVGGEGPGIEEADVPLRVDLHEMVGVARLRDPLERLEDALPLDVDLEGGDDRQAVDVAQRDRRQG